MKESSVTVYSTTQSILKTLDNTRDTSQTKALLANIRNSINKDITSNIDALAYIFSKLPENYLGNFGDLTNQEKATLIAIQMYAIHQQSSNSSVLKVYGQESKYKDNIGDALSLLRSDGSESIDKRFNAMVTSSNFKELKHHLRQLIKILKAKSDAKVDYAKLADDLYWYLMGQKDKIKLQWSRSFYKFRKNEKTEGEIQNEE